MTDNMNSVGNGQTPDIQKNNRAFGDPMASHKSAADEVTRKLTTRVEKAAAAVNDAHVAEDVAEAAAIVAEENAEAAAEALAAHTDQKRVLLQCRNCPTRRSVLSYRGVFCTKACAADFGFKALAKEG